MGEKHSKIRLTKRELGRVARLTDDGDDLVFDKPKRRRSASSRLVHFLISIFMALGILAGIGLVVLRGGIGSETLRSEAEQSLQQVLGAGATASIQSVALSVDDGAHLAIEAKGVSIDDPARGFFLRDIRSVKLGLAALPLLTGNIRVQQVEIDGVAFTLPESQGAGNPLQGLPLDGDGYVNLDALSNSVFTAVKNGIAVLDSQNTQLLAIRNSTLSFKQGGQNRQLQIDDLKLAQLMGTVTVVGKLDWSGTPIYIDGKVERSPDQKSLSAFHLSAVNIPVELGETPVVTTVANGAPQVNPAAFQLSGRGKLELRGHEKTDQQPARLDATLAINGLDMQLGKVDDVRGQVQLTFSHETGSRNIELQPSTVRLGGLDLKFSGAIGPDPEAATPRYRFEVVTSQATSAPAESTEPSLSFATRIAGNFDVNQRRLEFSNLDVKTASGELYGRGSMGFGQGSPEMIFFLRIPELAVTDAKHLWPIDVADGARAWVLKNIYGGTIRDSQIEVSLAAGRFNGPGLPPPLTGDEVKVDFNIFDTRFDVIGELPAVRDADGIVTVRGAHTTIKLPRGVAYTASNRAANVSDGTLIIPWGPQRPVIAELDLLVSGEAAAIAEIAGAKPIDVLKNIPFGPDDVKGQVNARVGVQFAVSKDPPPGTLKWKADIGLAKVDIAKPIGGSLVSEANGSIKVDQKQAIITADARLDGLPAKVSMIEPVDLSSGIKRSQSIKLEIDDKTRNTMMPGLRSLLTGKIQVEVGLGEGGERPFSVDLSNAEINLAALGWRKGSGIPAKASFNLVQNKERKANFELKDLSISGDTFGAKGRVVVANGDLQSLNLPQLQFTRGDSLSVKADRNADGLKVTINGRKFDARSLIKQISAGQKDDGNDGAGSSGRVVVNAQIDAVDGFNGETLKNVAISYETAGRKISGVSVNALTGSGQSFTATNNEQSGARSISLQSNDAGAILRFFDYYDKMQGGKITIGLVAKGNGPLQGQVDARNFSIINEPKLSMIVSNSPAEGGDSLNQAVKGKLDVSRVDIERGYSLIEKGNGYLNLSRGAVRGPTIGTTFQGTLYNKKGNMAITGTFMPAYGVNRLFGDVPVLGALLGNGRDGALLGITYKLTGNAKQPTVVVNPISMIAPGIFRSIFEF